MPGRADALDADPLGAPGRGGGGAIMAVEAEPELSAVAVSRALPVTWAVQRPVGATVAPAAPTTPRMIVTVAEAPAATAPSEQPIAPSAPAAGPRTSPWLAVAPAKCVPGGVSAWTKTSGAAAGPALVTRAV